MRAQVIFFEPTGQTQRFPWCIFHACRPRTAVAESARRGQCRGAQVCWQVDLFRPPVAHRGNHELPSSHGTHRFPFFEHVEIKQTCANVHTCGIDIQNIFSEILPTYKGKLHECENLCFFKYNKTTGLHCRIRLYLEKQGQFKVRLHRLGLIELQVVNKKKANKLP